MSLLPDSAALRSSRTDAEPSALVVHPSSQGAFSIRDGYFTNETKECESCGEIFHRYSKTGPSIWKRRKHCSRPRCRGVGAAERYEARKRQECSAPLDRGKEAKLFAGLSFEDDPRAVASESRFMKHPEPSRSGCGCAAEMCAR